MNVTQLIGKIEAGTLSARKAIVLLMAEKKYNERRARECVFFGLGGGDIIERTPQGIEIFQPGGRPVSEVQMLLER